MEILEVVVWVVWIIWGSLWGAFFIASLVWCRRWDRVAVGNLIFHLVGGVVGNLIFWAITGELDRVVGLFVVWYYSYEFVWHPLTHPPSPQLIELRKRFQKN